MPGLLLQPAHWSEGPWSRSSAQEKLSNDDGTRVNTEAARELGAYVVTTKGQYTYAQAPAS